ncbi:hypothetical protein CDL12_04739 [Handroanthus impetiginosus]|uniref:Uncharacterized protein n=1 Tax=Handroanthus impetiginosus TaxID=429701 RepID=A0A2G9HYF7_9LAMI|nr:hypothetical protein CDL12_04739 [Handroanthus impetiginosus]
MAGVTTEKSTKKKAKVAVMKVKDVAEKAVAERNEVAEEGFPAAEMDEWWMGLWSGVDEEMSWATSWCPFWEMENVGDAYDAFYGDVLWSFDIWDFKASGNNAPNP